MLRKDYRDEIYTGLFCPHCFRTASALLRTREEVEIYDNPDKYRVFQLSHTTLDHFAIMCPECGEKMVEIDYDILRAVERLNRAGYVTEYSCAGHFYPEHSLLMWPYITFPAKGLGTKKKQEIVETFTSLEAPTDKNYQYVLYASRPTGRNGSETETAGPVRLSASTGLRDVNAYDDIMNFVAAHHTSSLKFLGTSIDTADECIRNHPDTVDEFMEEFCGDVFTAATILDSKGADN